ncbi:amino acid transporter [Striga asiatica]|uniref:Amino acid transporter n=1 Tax=Striga asiatica TaxID=4170 RepID=A0A5A7P8W5_STRAF|nr:amino acid transporter [Striga asiatica]
MERDGGGDSTGIFPLDGENGVIKDVDAGALFVLKSQGSWLHCGYHLTTAIVGPALLSLPFAFTFLGWIGGIICLTFAAFITFYSYTLTSIVLEHYAQLGKRQLRYRDMAHHILGPGWGRYLVGPLQLVVCYGAVIATTLLGGQLLKFIYVISREEGSMQLYQFIVMYGSLTLIMAQMPSFHSLRHINLLSLLLCLAYSAFTAAASIYIGYDKEGQLEKDYSITSEGLNRIFGVFNAISIMATTYGNSIVPEIQATIAPPVRGKMLKGLLLCYSVVVSTYYSVAISGYWAFGNEAKGPILSNFIGADGLPLLPKSFLLIICVFTLVQLIAVTLVQRKFADPKKDQFSMRNAIPRLIFRSLSVIVATTLAAMLPFFGDIMALFGAIGCIPLDFILPMVFYNVTFKPSTKSFSFWVNIVIAVTSTVLCAVGTVASVRQIVLDAKTYKLFANM